MQTESHFTQREGKRTLLSVLPEVSPCTGNISSPVKPRWAELQKLQKNSGTKKPLKILLVYHSRCFDQFSMNFLQMNRSGENCAEDLPGFTGESERQYITSTGSSDK